MISQKQANASQQSSSFNSDHSVNKARESNAQTPHRASIKYLYGKFIASNLTQSRLIRQLFRCQVTHRDMWKMWWMWKIIFFQYIYFALLHCGPSTRVADWAVLHWKLRCAHVLQAWLYPLDPCMSSMYDLYLDPHPNPALGSLSPIQAVNPRNHYMTFIYS